MGALIACRARFWWWQRKIRLNSLARFRCLKAS